MSPEHPDLVVDESLVADADERSRMTFLEHLDELRRRILYALYAVLASCLVTFWFLQRMTAYLTDYFATYGATLIYTQPMGGFMFSLKIGVLAGVVVAAPFVFSQIWLFVAPGLYAREKKVVVPFVFFSSALFFGGAYFAHAIGFPAMWQFFASYGEGGSMAFFPDIANTFGFYVKVILGMGLVFQMPILVFFLARFRVITARFMLRKFKYAVLGVFIVAAIITPSGDAVTLSVFAAPMLVLYVVSIGVAWLFGPKRVTRDDEDDDDS
jgi:sec-independent protein translocase protein TatC